MLVYVVAAAVLLFGISLGYYFGVRSGTTREKKQSSPPPVSQPAESDEKKMTEHDTFGA